MNYKTYFSVWAAFERLSDKSDADLLLVDRYEGEVFRFDDVPASLLVKVETDKTGRFEIYEKVEVANDPAESV